jgi:hypothetical protein
MEQKAFEELEVLFVQCFEPARRLHKIKVQLNFVEVKKI